MTDSWASWGDNTLFEARDVARKGTVMQKITPCLWFDGKAEEAMYCYTSIFKNSKVGNVTRYGEAGPGEKGSVMVATFEIEGQQPVEASL